MASKGGILITPTSIVSTGAGNSSSINTNGSVTFSTCATLSLNGVFSADYDNYMIVMRMTGSTADSRIDCRLRLSGTDNSTASSYVFQEIYSSSTTVGANRTTSTFMTMGTSSSTQRDGLIINLYGPGLAQPTAVRSMNASGVSSAFLFDIAATHNQSTAYDGISFNIFTGNFTGLLAVYGMRK